MATHLVALRFDGRARYSAAASTLAAPGPTPAYLSDMQEEMAARPGPDAYVLRADDDPKAFAAVLDRLGVTWPGSGARPLLPET